MLAKLFITTSRKYQLIDITDKIKIIIKDENIADGLVLVFAQHTTCSIVVTEIEDKLESDLVKYIQKEGPKGPFLHSHGDLRAHDAGNADVSHTPAHILSALWGQARSFPVENNQILLGTWQRICLFEFDGPRKRRVLIKSLK